MTVISKRFADELTEKEMRDAFLEAQTRAKIALQIRALRNQRGLSQGALGEQMDKPQSNVARLEDREIARYTLSTLFELASVFDVGLIVEFVPYEYFLSRTQDLSHSHLQVHSFTRDALEPLCHDEPILQARTSVIGMTSGATASSPQMYPSYVTQLNFSSGGDLNQVTVGSANPSNNTSTASDTTTIKSTSVTTYVAPPISWYAGADRRIANVG